MSLTLCLDFGNTRKKCAVFNKASISEMLVLPDEPLQTLQTMSELVDRLHPEKSILSSVIEHDPAITTLLQSSTRFHLLNHETKLAFSTPVGKPGTIGSDRLALAAAAVHFYPKKNNLVIGLGTCITYNYINKFHEFLGGGISPGLEMRLKSLKHYTAKLPLVTADSNVPLIGYDTVTNIQSGVVMGMAKEIDGFIESYKERFWNFNVLLTGGDIVYLGSHLKSKIFADPDFLFKGLYAISEANNC